MVTYKTSHDFFFLSRIIFLFIFGTHLFRINNLNVRERKSLYLGIFFSWLVKQSWDFSVQYSDTLNHFYIQVNLDVYLIFNTYQLKNKRGHKYVLYFCNISYGNHIKFLKRMINFHTLTKKINSIISRRL